MYEPGTHSGHVGQPRPEPVNRTNPPVTTMAAWATTLSSRIREVTVLTAPEFPIFERSAGSLTDGVYARVLLPAEGLERDYDTYHCPDREDGDA